jgi:hypothetical protein
MNETVKGYLAKAFKSVDRDKAEVLIVYTPNVTIEQIQEVIGMDDTNLWFILNPETSDFCSQVNYGAKHVTTDWFSILEYDDSYAPKWFDNVDTYIAAYGDVDVFLPIVADVDEHDKFISFTNETLWALGFSEVQGYLDNASLLEYQNFQISGAVYNTGKFLKFGGLKSNIKLSFGYELLLRLTHNNLKVMTIPKIGYKHTNMRTDSLFWKYKNDEQQKLSSQEGKFWMDAARKEYYFTEQRDISYSEPQ